MNKTITIYGKQEAIIYTSEQGELIIHETETHGRNHITQTLAKILNKPTKELKVSFEKSNGTVIYNDGCRRLDFNLGFIQK